jgi:tubulin-specific chaperone D
MRLVSSEWFTLSSSIMLTRFRWKSILSLVQKSHYQSAHVPKILAALEVYRGLADVEAIRSLAFAKIESMILHNYTKVRIAAAETLILITDSEAIRAELKTHDWSRSRVELKEIVASFVTLS